MMEHEELLILRAKSGDTGAFGDLYDLYYPRIYRFIYLKVGRREECEDLTHEVFISAWEHMEDYVHRGHPFGSWLYRIARNAVVDHYRTRRVTVVIEELNPDVLEDDFDAESAAEERMLLTQIRSAIAELKPEQQDVILLRFVEEFSVRETALALGKSEGAVKLLQHRAVAALKEKMAEERQPTLNEWLVSKTTWK